MISFFPFRLDILFFILTRIQESEPFHKNIAFSSCKKQEASTCSANVSKVKKALLKEPLIKETLMK